nr:cuticle protein 38-like [Leptinotarsa decemlineata]
MFKLVALLALTGAVLADPKPSGVFAAAPLTVAPAVAPAVVTAHSSQVVARNFNALVAPSAPFVAAAPVAAVRSPLVAAPVVASPYVAAPYVASPYAASPYFASPYVAAPAFI